MAVLEAKNLSAGFAGKKLFQDLSFSIPKPSFVAILGHNGSGKSTLLKTLIKPNPFNGSVTVEGISLSFLNSVEVSSRISFLAQKNMISFSIPVRELVVMGKFRDKGFFSNYNQEDYRQVSQLLASLNLSHLEEKDFTSLSGGEQQMVLLAQVLLQNTAIILLDEPTQQLDRLNKRRVFSLLKEMCEKHNKTILCVTHDLDYLHYFNGHYFLNLTDLKPVLKSLSPESIRDAVKTLEEERQ